MDSYKTDLVRKLKFECRELRKELSEAHEIYSSAVRGFCAHVVSFCLENSLPDPLDSLSSKNSSPSASDQTSALIAESLSEEEKKQLPASFKKVFRSIALHTHPDKTDTDDGRELYEQAVSAQKDNQVDELVSIAQELRIDISHLRYSEIKIIEEQIEKTKKEIDSLHDTFPWHWHYSPTNKREKIIRLFLDSQQV